jgi:hypothetical protein
MLTKSGSLSSRRKREALRRTFLPQQVCMLFIGESPPASGRFFYSGNSGLYRAVRDVFQIVDPSINDDTFLARFREYDCYLIDACRDPVDQLEPKARRAACIEGEAWLSRSIRRLHPEMIVSLVRSIRDNVERAIDMAHWHGPILHLPYPGRWIRHREIFSAELLPYVTALLDRKDLK